MSTLGIPAHLLAAAAALPENAHAREALESQAAAERSREKLEPPAKHRRTTADARREAEVQSEIVKLLRRRGAQVWDTSQPRAVKVTPGLPDLVVFDAYRGLLFIEVKAPGGAPSEEQVRFQQLCQHHGVQHIMGGVAEVRAFFNREAAG